MKDNQTSTKVWIDHTAKFYNSSVVECPPLIWNVGCSTHDHWVNRRRAPWARAFP